MTADSTVSGAALGRRRNPREAFVPREGKPAWNSVARKRFRKCAKQCEPSRIDPTMPSLEKERVATLLEQLRDEIALAHKGTAGCESSGRSADEIDISQRTGEIVREVPGFRAEQYELLVSNDRNRRRV